MTTWRDTLARVAAVAVVAAWAGACVWLLGHGRYAAFLSARLWPLLAGALVMLVLFLGAMVGRRRGGATGGDSGGGSGGVSITTLGWVALPLAYLIVAPPSGLDSYALAMRGVTVTSSASESSPPVAVEPPEGPTPPAEATVSVDPPPAQDVSLMELLVDMHRYQGQRVKAVGMVHHDPKNPAGHFVLFRFVVACCAADASPVGALVRCENPQQYHGDTWLAVTGTVELVAVGQDQGPCLVAETIEAIEAPDEIYLSPW